MIGLRETMGGDPRSAAPTQDKMQIRTLSDVLGAEITGIDLSILPSAPPIRERIISAFEAYHLVAVRDQKLTPQQQYDFSITFGELEQSIAEYADGSQYPLVNTVSNLDSSGKPSEKPYSNYNYYWHSDKAFFKTPSLITMLHAIEIPRSGGDTQFANMIKAYDALPGAMKRRIEGLRVIHSLEYMRKSLGGRPPTKTELERSPPIAHPLVRIHPPTGKRSLFLGMYCAEIVGLPSAEGRALLDELQAHATQPQFVYTHKWRVGDLVFWDNRCLLHRAIPNYDMSTERRLLNRTCIRGEAP